MEAFEFKVLVNPDHEHKVSDDVVAFGDFEGPCVFSGPGALASFYSELILGRPFPLMFLVRDVCSVSTLFATALFLRRELAIHPRMPGLLTAATLVDQYREAGFAHIPSDVGQFFELLENYLQPPLSRSELSARLSTALEWIYDLVTEEVLPSLPPRVPIPILVDVGSVGFVVAETARKDLRRGWIELYRQGFLRGVLYHRQGERLHVLVARKSPFLAFDLRKGADVLNEAEAAMGEPSGWLVDGLWLHGPEKGTLLPMEAITKVLVKL